MAEPEPRLSWFGESWGAPVCIQAPQTAVPEGTRCASCREPIRVGESGLRVPHHSAHRGVKMDSYHRHCFGVMLGLDPPRRR